MIPSTLRFGSGMLGAGLGIAAAPEIAPVGAVAGWVVGDKAFSAGYKRFMRKR